MIVQTPLPTLNCDPSGYLVQVSNLYRVNITTGVVTTIKSGMAIGSRTLKMNAMGYNVADNFLYAATFDAAPYDLIRISGTGDCVNMGSLNISFTSTCGDVDENSQYWAARDGKDWIQVDLKPGSATYGQTITKGVASPSMYVIDWAYVPKKGNYLWGVGCESDTRASTYLMRFDRTAKSWTTVVSFGDIAGTGGTSKNTWGAVYASDDGYLYGSENNSGEIWRFPLPNNGVGVPSGLPMKISTGPYSPGGNDGARCIKASNI